MNSVRIFIDIKQQLFDIVSANLMHGSMFQLQDSSMLLSAEKTILTAKITEDAEKEDIKLCVLSGNTFLCPHHRKSLR
jgi:hypothetical protein